MPRGDGTGPMGQGPMSGKGFGNCSGYQARGFGRGAGYGKGFGYGFCNRAGFFSVPSSERETIVLQEESELLQNRLNNIKMRLDELGKPKS
ncbi:MAG: DUF5320 domain-containing protein [Desulfobacterales bacterium]|nr:DUF5320 domain-containing protein [Desulfobacterales bacterium]